MSGKSFVQQHAELCEFDERECDAIRADYGAMVAIANKPRSAPVACMRALKLAATRIRREPHTQNAALEPVRPMLRLSLKPTENDSVHAGRLSRCGGAVGLRVLGLEG